MSGHKQITQWVFVVGALWMGSVSWMSPLHAQPRFLRQAHRIVFLGDSITNDGRFINVIEAEFRHRFGGKAPEMINLGLPSETISGLSEPDHPFPRPNVHERLSRVLTKASPEVVIACYGINDGIYYPFDEKRFAAFQKGIRRLISVAKRSRTKLVLMTPPPFDPLPMRMKGKLLPLGAPKYSWTKIYQDYDQVMKRYAEFVLEQKSQVAQVIDLHTPINAFLAKQRKSDSKYTMSGDGVHIDLRGHQVLAKAILDAWKMEPRAPKALVDLLAKRRTVMHAAWLSAVGHKRPGVKPGLKLEEAYSKVKSIDRQLEQHAMPLKLRSQIETAPKSGRCHTRIRNRNWAPEETALIVCDVWDYHHCYNAVQRLNEMMPVLDRVIAKARAKGVTIIHSPSDCMPAYQNHPARKRALAAPKVVGSPESLRHWCSIVPSEEAAVYPIDQSDGGEDDDPVEHAQWAKKLAAMGRNPNLPWKKQNPAIHIDPERDFISDRGDEVWNVLKQRGIKNVILTGVHTNMCVLGRPFGLRQMVRQGMNVVLMRDMTDTMYNPQRWPYVNHFSGTDLVISHIERYVCPTISSDQILGGEEFRFSQDKRPHIAMVIAEDEYATNQTLPNFALGNLGDYRVSMIFGNENERNDIPGLERVSDADILLISVRRRALPARQMVALREWIDSGKPVIGIRTASHAFSLRGKKPPKGTVTWEKFDPEVFGGHYTNHHGNQLSSTVTLNSNARKLTTGIERKQFPQAGSLYMVRPLQSGAKVVAFGEIAGKPKEPVAWTFTRKDGGKSFYTSLGHPGDFARPEFQHLLRNAIDWGLGRSRSVERTPKRDPKRDHWTVTNIPGNMVMLRNGHNISNASWYRSVIRVPASWLNEQPLHLKWKGPISDRVKGVWWNGKAAQTTKTGWVIPGDAIGVNDANLLVVHLEVKGNAGMTIAPSLIAGDNQMSLKGKWQVRVGNHPDWRNMPLPAKFGTGTDIIFRPGEK